MEFLLGRILEDAVNNLGLEGTREALTSYGVTSPMWWVSEPDAALGNGGLGGWPPVSSTACPALAFPAYGYGIRYAHGLFRQSFEDGKQVEMAEDWLRHQHNWEFERSECHL
jgi:starch phosphorylase